MKKSIEEVVAQMNAEEKRNKKLTLEIDLNEKLPDESHTRHNMGYSVIMKIYHELELDRFLNNKTRHEAFEYNTNSIMTFLNALEPSVNVYISTEAIDGTECFTRGYY